MTRTTRDLFVLKLLIQSSIAKSKLTYSSAMMLISRLIKGIKTFFRQEFAQHIGEGDINLFLGQLGFKLKQKLVDHTHDDDFIQRFEADGCI